MNRFSDSERAASYRGRMKRKRQKRLSKCLAGGIILLLVVCGPLYGQLARGGLSGRDQQVEQQLRQAVEREPESFAANHNLGEFYIHVGKLTAGLPFLEKAYRLDASHYVNAYDLALALLNTRNLEKARSHLQRMIQRREVAELQNLLGAVEEETGNIPAAVEAYQRAAHLEPSEQNLFDWGTLMVRHGVLEPALEIFAHGVKRHPRSERLHLGHGVALYARGRYEEAVKSFYAATDLNPSDPQPYLFLGKAYNISTAQAEGVTERLRRFAELHPKNGMAQYYFALSLWKGKGKEEGQNDLKRVESLLRRAALLDPRLADAHLQLGILYAQQERFPEAIQEYRSAIRLQPELAKAHYRLGQAYMRTGEREQAQEQMALYERVHRQQLQDDDKRRLEVRNFYFRK